jgi:hypothetical protein
VAAVVLVGAISLWFVHSRYSGTRLEDDLEEGIIRKMAEEFKPTWMDRVTSLCIIIGAALLLIHLMW